MGNTDSSSAQHIRLVKAAKRGDKQAFVQLLTLLEQKLYQTALGIVGNRQDAEDVWQNTAYKAWINIGSLRQPKHFVTWMTRILLNEAKSLLRSRNRSLLPLAELPGIPEEIPNIERKLFVRTCLNMLPVHEREVILLRYWLDMPLKEIAKVLAVPESTVKYRLYHGLNSLLRIIEEECRSER